MRISRKLALELYKELGYQTAGSWSNEKLQTKINKISNVVEEGEELDNPKMNKLLEKVMQNEGQIEVVDEVAGQEEALTEEVAVENEPVKVKKEKKERVPRVKKEKAPKEVSQFGSKKGSQAGIIEDAFDGKTSVKALAEKTGLKAARVAGHLQFLVKKGVLEKVGDEYVTKSA